MAAQYHAVGADLPEPETKFWTPFLRQLHISSAVWTVTFVVGLCTGAPTVFVPQMRRENTTVVIDDELASWLYSTSNLSALPWALILPAVTHYVGRKAPYFATSLIMTVVFIILYFSSSPYQILVAQIIQGFGNASNATILFHVVPEYVDPKYRSVLANLHFTSFFWGMWVANAIGAYFPWKYIIYLGIVCTLYSFTVILYPESPHWLASKGRFEECETAYRWLRGSGPDTERELRELVKHQTDQHVQEAENNWSWLMRTVKCRQFYYPLLLSLLVGAQSNLSGKFICSIYAIDIIKKITKDDSAAITGMMILDGATVSGMYFGSCLSKFVRIRTLYFRAMFVCIVSLLTISLYLYLVALGVLVENNIVSLCLLVAYSLSISCGPIILTMVIYGEIICIRYEAVSYAISSFVYIATCSGMLKFSPALFSYCGMHGSFLFFGVTSGTCVVLLHIYLPETKDKTLVEIQNYFKDSSTVGEVEKLTTQY